MKNVITYLMAGLMAAALLTGSCGRSQSGPGEEPCIGYHGYGDADLQCTGA